MRTRYTKTEGRQSVKKVYSAAIALVPVLAPYATFINGIYLHELVLIILSFISITYRKSCEPYPKTMRPLYYLALAIYVSICINILFNYGQTNEVLVRSTRMMFYILCICFTSKRLLDIQYLAKSTVYIGICSVLFLFVQIVIYRTTGTYIKGVGNILPLAYRSDFDYQYYMSRMLRPSSIFIEPSGMSQYLLVPISYLLLSKERNVQHDNRNIIISIIISIGIIFTTSLWGVVLLIIIWCAWITRAADINRHFVILAVILPTIIYIVTSTTVIDTTFSRIDTTNLSNLVSSQSFSGRFSGYEVLKDLDIVQKLFGLGFGNLHTLKDVGTGNSIVYYILGIGIAGTSMFLLLCMSSLRYISELWQRVILVCMLVLSFGAGIINTTMIVYYYNCFAFRVSDSKTEMEHKSDKYRRR